MLATLHFPSGPEGLGRDETLKAELASAQATPELNHELMPRATFLPCADGCFLPGGLVLGRVPHARGNRPVEGEAEHENQAVEPIGSLDLAFLWIEAARLVIREHRLDPLRRPQSSARPHGVGGSASAMIQGSGRPSSCSMAMFARARFLMSSTSVSICSPPAKHSASVGVAAPSAFNAPRRPVAPRPRPARQAHVSSAGENSWRR